ncbi:MAG: hypothetical protein PWR19_1188 [Carnobacterium sp.]|uniref:hypothetical protein n=1 Tax=Carnobacterium sp. TaxID=48221 RepID=UPI00264946BA|nr:hypothetical protein [Carnobacterium sp.]MDN5372142.1 hypothetical protein [Carnobacterium sp.]
MKFESNEGSTNHYDERLFLIDEKICELLNDRKEIVKSNLGFPPDKVISSLADEYGFQKEYLQSLFSTIEMEDHYEPTIEPVEFQKYLPVLKAYGNQKVLYTVTYIRQYANASVLYLHMDWEEKEDANFYPDMLDLFINDTYFCHSEGGGGTTGHASHSYIISPALPDELTGIELVFKEAGRPFVENPTGFEFSIKLG